MKKKKDAYLKNKQATIDNTNVFNTTVFDDLRKARFDSEKKTETKPKQKEVTEVVKGSSFGQSAGLKDDLDVEDDVGRQNLILTFTKTWIS